MLAGFFSGIVVTIHGIYAVLPQLLYSVFAMAALLSAFLFLAPQFIGYRICGFGILSVLLYIGLGQAHAFQCGFLICGFLVCGDILIPSLCLVAQILGHILGRFLAVLGYLIDSFGLRTILFNIARSNVGIKFAAFVQGLISTLCIFAKFTL